MTDASDAWIKHLCKLNNHGEYCQSRNGSTLELLNQTIEYQLEYPIVLAMDRKLSYKYMACEALWTLKGSNRLDFHSSIYKTLKKWSGDQIYLKGGYGPAFLSQMPYILDVLKRHDGTRQAVMTIWEPSPRFENDMPCTISIQFLIRDNTINAIVNMRSSDAWLGLPNDMFVFAMMTYAVALEFYSVTGKKLDYGQCYINVASAHIYDKDKAKATKIILYSPKISPTRPIKPYAYVDLINWLTKISQQDDPYNPFNLIEQEWQS